MVQRRLVRIAAVILVTLGAGHLVLATVVTGSTLLGWAANGVWAAVPLLGSRDSPLAALNALAFWAGPGSFAVPLATLGLLLWHLAGRDVRVPRFVGWIIAVWCCVGGLVLVPSPFVVGAAAGVLVAVAGRTRRAELV